MVPKLFKKRYKEKCTHNTFSMPKTLTEIGADDRTKGQTKAVILVPTPAHTQCFKISDFIIATSFKIKLFQMLMATKFLRNNVLI